MNAKSKILTIAATQLDTVWNWDFEYTINNHLKELLSDNLSIFDEFPDYQFNFDGAYRYELIEEYYPDEFELLQDYVQKGNWKICSAAYESINTNIVSPETMFRNILYAKHYYWEKFKKTTNDIFLPVGNGFSWTLPSVARHCNLKGFSTGRLIYDSTYPLPFDVGNWQGVDGNSIYASLDSKFCNVDIKKVRKNPTIVQKLEKNIKDSGLNMTLTYCGSSEYTAENICNEMAQNDTSNIEVVSSSPNEFFAEIETLERTGEINLPVWDKELSVSNHGVGSYTSRGFSKRIHKRNEEIADMAERASVMAMCVTDTSYPNDELKTAWKRVLAHSASNDISGTAVERAYIRSWNDSIMSANQFTNIYEGSSAQIIKNLDTSWTKGLAVIVQNSIEFARTSVVDLTIPSAGFKYIRVFNENAEEVPSQVNNIDEKNMSVSILASVPAMGFCVYDLCYTHQPCEMDTGLKISEDELQNNQFTVKINKNGDISSIIDKTLDSVNPELLFKPIRFELHKYKGTKEAPAWSLDYEELKKYPWEFAEEGICSIEEQGTVRVTLKVEQIVGKSIFTYYVSLSPLCPWVAVYNEIEWHELEKCLHNSFTFTAENSFATYDLGLGTIQRPKANKKLYSVPAQKWADISDPKRNFGVSVFSDSKTGWLMKRSDTLKLTAIHSPKYAYKQDSMQNMMDFGLNRYGYAIYSHQGECGISTQMNARFFNQPLTGFISNKHFGMLGSSYQFCSLNNSNAIIRAIKKAEYSDEIIVRINEGAKQTNSNIELSLGLGILKAREVYASEEHKCDAMVANSKLIFDLNPYEVKTFAITLLPCHVATAKKATPVPLPFNSNFLTSRYTTSKALIPTINASIPTEIYPQSIKCGSIDFCFADPKSTMNALISGGQEIIVNKNKLYLIAASLYGDRPYEFKINGEVYPVNIQSIDGKIGAWDLFNLNQVANIKTDRLAWVCTHTHSLSGVNVGQELYFFMYEFNVANVQTITLPEDNGLVILAASESDDTDIIKLCTDLYDRVENRSFNYKLSTSQKNSINEAKKKATPAFQKVHSKKK